MKLYLSSYRFCNDPKQYAEMFGDNKKVAVVTNALDFSTDEARLEQGLQREFQELTRLGLTPVHLDLRRYFGQLEELTTFTKQLGGVWVVGGNSFLLRKAMRLSGFDSLLKELHGDLQFVYGGYSAGICVLGPSLKGLELVDDPTEKAAGYPPETIWEGLGIVGFCLVPHYKSPHNESEKMNAVVDSFIENKVLFKCLHDGDALILNNTLEK